LDVTKDGNIFTSIVEKKHACDGCEINHQSLVVV